MTDCIICGRPTQEKNRFCRYHQDAFEALAKTYEEWNKAFGGNDVDRGYCVQQTTDGGYILTGYTSSFGAGLDDMWLIKTDTSGNEEWNKTFGGTGRDYGNAVQQTINGGYIIAGYTLSYGAGNEDVWLVKTDASGNEVWDRTFGGVYSDVGYAVQQTTDTGYIVTGHTLSYGAGLHDVWLIKIENNEIPPLEVDAGGPYNGSVGEPVQFTGTAYNGVEPYTWHWDFGDGNDSDVQNPTHTYMAAGVYDVTLTVTDFEGNSSNDTTTATITGGYTPISLTITKPDTGIYIADRKILPFPVPVVIGKITIEVNASQVEYGIDRIELFIDDSFKENLTDEPYSWLWSDRAFFRHTITAVAYDDSGQHASKNLTVWKFF